MAPRAGPIWSVKYPKLTFYIETLFDLCEVLMPNSNSECCLMMFKWYKHKHKHKMQGWIRYVKSDHNLCRLKDD